MEWNPYCCDGVSFSNPCMAECKGIPDPAEDYCIQGICENIVNPCVCPLHLDPYCCDETEYANLCDAQCNGYKESECEHREC